jgi:hypothetical protein
VRSTSRPYPNVQADKTPIQVSNPMRHRFVQFVEVPMTGMSSDLAGTARLVVAIGTATLLVIGGLAKLGSRERFRLVLADYGAIPRGLSATLARTIPLIELAVATILVVPPMRTVGLISAAAFLTATAAVVAISLSMGRIPSVCGCLGDTDGPPTRATAIRAFALASAAAAVVPLADPGLAQTTLGSLAGVVLGLGWWSYQTVMSSGSSGHLS